MDGGGPLSQDNPYQGSLQTEVPRWSIGAGPGTLTGGTSAARHRDSPSLHHFQSENPPGKPKGRIIDPGPVADAREREATAKDTLSISSEQVLRGEEGSQRPGRPSDPKPSDRADRPSVATEYLCTSRCGRPGLVPRQVHTRSHIHTYDRQQYTTWLPLTSMATSPMSRGATTMSTPWYGGSSHFFFFFFT